MEMNKNCTVTLDWLSRAARFAQTPRRVGEVLRILAPRPYFSFLGEDPTAFQEIETFDLFSSYVDDEDGNTKLRWVLPPHIRIAL